MDHSVAYRSSVWTYKEKSPIHGQVKSKVQSSVSSLGGVRRMHVCVCIYMRVFSQIHMCVSSDGKESACNADTQVQPLGREDPLEKGMATHSSILAWRIPWTEEPGRLQSMGSQRVIHD